MKNLTKAKFIEIIDFIRDRKCVERKINDIMTDEYDNCIFFPNTKYESKVIELLEYIMDDTNHWISYFIYDLDFGNKHEIGNTFWNDNGEPIPLGTPEELYNFLMEKNKK